MRILVTGVTGFIGSHFARMLLDTTAHSVVGFARCSDMRGVERLELEGKPKNPHFRLISGDLAEPSDVSGICEGVDIVVNFAAKTFVDASLRDRQPFIRSNILGADNLMEDATRYGVKRFIQISTDEVYGQILQGAYKEDALVQPRNPYSWSKACADLNAIWRHRTYGFPVVISRTENNFGQYQHRQKVIPTFVRHALAGDPLPIYGDGLHVRCWLHVEEHCRAIWHLCEKGVVGEIYHVAGEEEMTNLDLAKTILLALGKKENDKPFRIRFIDDANIRPGHDRRYALNCDKLKATGFMITQDLPALMEETAWWYANHREWMT